jgi:hypothetical protein
MMHKSWESHLFAFLSKGFLSGLSIHIGIRENERRKGKKAGRDVTHTSSFRPEKNEFQKDEMICPSLCFYLVVDTELELGIP